jgi:protein SCO1/2
MFKFFMNLAIVLMLAFLGYSYSKNDGSLLKKAGYGSSESVKSGEIKSVEGSKSSSVLDDKSTEESNSKSVVREPAVGNMPSSSGMMNDSGSSESHSTGSHGSSSGDSPKMGYSDGVDHKGMMHMATESSPEKSQQKKSSQEDAGMMVSRSPGGDFALKDQNNQLIDTRALRGKYLIVTFGYATCKTTCPVVLAMISSVLDKLGADADKVVPLFVNIDSEQTDSMQIVKSSDIKFDGRIHVLSGSPSEIKDVAGKYMAYVGHKEGDGNINHSGYIYFIDQNGSYISHFSPPSNDPSSGQTDDVDSMHAAIKEKISKSNS